MKKLIALLLTAFMVTSMFAASVTTVSSTPSNDPADSYVVQTAPEEDSDIQMWFNHANVKVHQEDTTPSGRDTYSIYMAKNEYQGANVTLYSPSVTKQYLSAEISEFTAMNGSGATMNADLFYEAYVQCSNLDTTDVLGVDNSADSFIREGNIPEALIEMYTINQAYAPGKFTLTAGLTQSLYIKVKSELDTPSGWYSAQFNVLSHDPEGEMIDPFDEGYFVPESFGASHIIKTATVYAYVWNFEIPEEIHYQTGIYIAYGTGMTEELYKNYYDYLLDNRICGMNVPGTLDSNNEYVTNPRVTAFRVSDRNSYLGLYNSSQIQAVYDDLSTLDDWDNIKEKVYFYVADEPRSAQQQSYGGATGNPTVATLVGRYATVANGWEDPYVLVAIDENHPYPAEYPKTVAYDAATGTYLTTDDKSGRFDAYNDAMQGMMNDNTVTLWCCKTDMFTPKSVTDDLGYDGSLRTYKVKNMNGIISGFDCGIPSACYFDWDTKYNKTFAERFSDYQNQKALQGTNIKLWVYECGKGPDYTYCNHLIENTGLQTELLFWQSMQIGATGYLYYGANLWREHATSPSAPGSSPYYDGTMMDGIWEVNKYTPNGAPGTNAYGNGVLFYGNRIRSGMFASNKLYGNSKKPIGTLRVENMRDGIEEYEMLYMYGEAFGEAAKQEFIERVSNNVVDYLSMPSFDTSEYDGLNMTDEDIFAAVRIDLGNALETAIGPHEHTWGDGVVTKQATYTDTGLKVYTCSGCGETMTEVIPMLDPLFGDVNGDTKLNGRDLQMLKKYLAGVVTENEIVIVNSDVNEDTKVNGRDFTLIKKILAGN